MDRARRCCPPADSCVDLRTRNRPGRDKFAVTSLFGARPTLQRADTTPFLADCVGILIAPVHGQ
jgi:hypothetical protein